MGFFLFVGMYINLEFCGLGLWYIDSSYAAYLYVVVYSGVEISGRQLLFTLFSEFRLSRFRM
jgi:hypothetical protein